MPASSVYATMSDVNSIEIDIAGDVVEWQTLLSGMQIATVEGATADGAWTLSGNCSWNPRSGLGASEGDLTLSRNDGAELFASLSAGTVVEELSESGDAAGYDAHLELAVDGGAGEFEGAAGSIVAAGRLSRDGFRMQLRVSVTIDGDG